MKKRELLRSLRCLGVGDEIILGLDCLRIQEVIEYNEGEDTWWNLVWHDKADGREVALEVEDNKLTLWGEMKDITNADVDIVKSPKTIKYRGEIYQLEENGSARTFSETKGKLVVRDETPWWVYIAKSGHKLAVEIWDNDVRFYYADGELPAKNVLIPS